jgi:molybdate transport system substrate-binding protein
MKPLAALVALLALAAAGCGDEDAEGGAGNPRLVVSAASSMTEALTACSRDFAAATVRFSFAGSDELAAQIRQGLKPDVYAAANARLPEELHREGRLEAPSEFATNELVIAVPAGSDIRSIDDLTEAGVKIAIGSDSVPIGTYTRETLAKLPADQEQAILDNVRSKEPDVQGIVGKLLLGAADAGFVYVTDVKAANGELHTVGLPDQLEPDVTYAAGVIEGAKQPEAARSFVDGLADGACADALKDAGFGAAPR